MQQSTIVNLCLKSADLILFFLVVIYGSFRKALFDCFKGNFKLKLLLKTAVSKNSINVSSKEPCSPFSCQFSFFTHSNENSIGFLVSFTAWVSVFEVFLFRIFSYLDWIRRYGVSLYIQSKYGKIPTRTRKTPNTGTFHAVTSLSLLLLRIFLAKERDEFYTKLKTSVITCV